MRATDLEINFRKLVRDDNGSGYKSTGANEKTVDRMKVVAGKRARVRAVDERVWAFGTGLSRIWPGLAESSLG